MAVFARTGDQTRTSRRGVWMLAVAPLAVIALAVGTAFAADAVYAHRALPGMTVGGIEIGSLETNAVRERLGTELAAPWAASTVALVDGSRTWQTTNAKLGIAPDIDAAVTEALSYGKSGGIFDRLGAWIDAIRGQANVPFAMHAKGDALDLWVAAAARDTDRAPVSGELRVGTAGLEVTQPALGREVDRVGTVAALLSADSLGDREVALRVRTSYPAVDAAGFDEAYARAAAVVTPVSVHVEDRTFTENANYLSSLLAIDRVAAQPGELPAIPQDAIAPAVRYRYEVSLVNERVASWAAALGVVLDHPGKSAKFRISLTRDNHNGSTGSFVAALTCAGFTPVTPGVTYVPNTITFDPSNPTSISSRRKSIVAGGSPANTWLAELMPGRTSRCASAIVGARQSQAGIRAGPMNGHSCLVIARRSTW